MSKKAKSNLLQIAKIINTHGIKGEIKIDIDSVEVKDFLKIGQEIFILFKDEYLSYKITGVRFHKNFFLLTLEGITNINEVEKYKTFNIYVETTKKLKSSATEINGFKVVCENEEIGEVLFVWKQGPYKSIEIKLFENEKVTNIPWISNFIIEIDIINKLVFINVTKDYFN